MKKDIEKTKVKFMFHEKNEDLYAFFPENIEAEFEDDNLYLCYSHIGQHGTCCMEYVNKSRSATFEEYKDLYSELENLIGYNLEVLN